MSPKDHTKIDNRQNYYSYRTYNASGELTASGDNLSMGATVALNDTLDINSVVTPNWETYKRWNRPVNPYYKYVLLKKEFGGKFAQRARNLSTGHYTDFTYDVNLGALSHTIVDDPATDADDLTQKTISKLIAEISLTKANSAVTAAEFGKTAQHLAHTASRVYKGLNGLRRGRFGDFADALGMTYTTRDVKTYNKRFRRARREDKLKWKTVENRLHVDRHHTRVTEFVADTWLEYSYAWKPLLSDLYSHANAFATLMVETGHTWRYCTVRTSSERRTDGSTIAGQMVIADAKHSRKFMAMGVKYRIPEGALNLTTALGLQNPLIVAWELVPFSFVVDWFLPIGDALSALSAFNGLEFHSGWSSTRHIRVNTRKILPGPVVTSGGMSYTVTEADVEGTMYEFGMTRSALSDFPTFGFPQFKDPRSLAHGASAIALLQSLFLRK